MLKKKETKKEAAPQKAAVDNNDIAFKNSVIKKLQELDSHNASVDRARVSEGGDSVNKGSKVNRATAIKGLQTLAPGLGGQFKRK